MFQRLFTIALAAILIASTPSRVDTLPGIDAPDFTAAVEKWLAEEDPREALREIGRLASSGNEAAQYFANQLFRTGWRQASQITHDEMLKAFPRTADDERARPWPLATCA